MKMSKWAEHEVELACKKENPDWDGKSFDYGRQCYLSALKAYKSLLEDGHSGMSWGITIEILNKLCDHIPLTPITEDDFDDSKNEIHCPKDYLEDNGLISDIYCNRMSGLYRGEKLDGTIIYRDINRAHCIDIDDPHRIPYHCWLTNFVDEYCPITMPYQPSIKKYICHIRSFLVNPENGDFDTECIYDILTPDGTTIKVNKFYTFFSGEWNEISEEEFNELYEKRIRNK